MGLILDRIHALGLELPPVHPHTNPNRTACVRSGNVLYLSGHSSGRHDMPLGVMTTGMVNSAPGFERQFAVMDGASDLFYAVWGPDRGCHARTAVGIAELPRRAVIEINGEFELAG